MRKLFAASIALSILCVATTCGAQAEKTDKNNQAKDAKQEKKSHDGMMNKECVLGISSLSDQQKTNIQSAYDQLQQDLKPIQVQIRDKKEAAWSKIEALLNEAQLAELDKMRADIRAKRLKDHPHPAKKQTAKDTADDDKDSD
ncbi:MAG: hypothetical protein K2W82_14010 [Candidatus Obscuribacterales bacterium]|nr:hypothetical protein [Candidatus Obscuribacterales bacterium]